MLQKIYVSKTLIISIVFFSCMNLTKFPHVENNRIVHKDNGGYFLALLLLKVV